MKYDFLTIFNFVFWMLALIYALKFLEEIHRQQKMDGIGVNMVIKSFQFNTKTEPLNPCFH